MARKFETASIVSPAAAYLRADSFTHINSAFDELTNAIVKGLLSSYTTDDVIILNGCVVSGTVVAPGPAAITAGQVFYNGRIYEVDAVASLALTGAQVPVFTIVSTQQGGQTTFTDGNPYNFQTIEKFAMTAGLSGSGASGTSSTNVANAKFLKKTKRISIGTWDMDTDAFVDVNHGLASHEWLKASIIGISIIADGLGTVNTLGITKTVSAGSGDGFEYINVTTVRLSRWTAGAFDSTNFNDTSINRGYIDILYGDI